MARKTRLMVRKMGQTRVQRLTLRDQQQTRHRKKRKLQELAMMVGNKMVMLEKVKKKENLPEDLEEKEIAKMMVEVVNQRKVKVQEAKVKKVKVEEETAPSLRKKYPK